MVGASMTRTRRAEEADFAAVVIDSPSSVGFYPNSKGEKRKNAPTVRLQGVRGRNRFTGEALA